MPLDKWFASRAGIPPWTKYQSSRAIVWLVVLLVLAALSFTITWLIPSLAVFHGRPTPGPATIRLVSTAELLAIASSVAHEDNPAAVPCSMELYPRRTGDTLTYAARTMFFSPDDADWNLTVTVWRSPGLIGNATHVREATYPQHVSQALRCVRRIDLPVVDGTTAFDAMQEAGASSMFEYFDRWPVYLRLVQDPQGSPAWEGLFRSLTPGDSLRIAVIVDGATAEVIATEARTWP